MHYFQALENGLRRRKTVNFTGKQLPSSGRLLFCPQD